MSLLQSLSFYARRGTWVWDGFCRTLGGRPRIGEPLIVLAISAAVLVAAAGFADAQIQLPGAAGFGGGGNGASPPPAAGGGGEHLPPRPVIMDPPSIETVVGHPLSLDGRKGVMQLDSKDNASLTLSKLTFAGEKISKPGQSCSVDVPLTSPLVLTAAGRPAGTNRYDAAVPSCPLSLDILNGAALVRSQESACMFAAADCKVEPGGLWGPPAAEISPKRATELERERVKLETNMRANFHALIRKAGPDRAAVKALARDQAAFSSEREMTCRDYQDESTHGFCSTQITEARALALMAQFGPVPKARAARSATKPQP